MKSATFSVKWGRILFGLILAILVGANLEIFLSYEASQSSLVATESIVVSRAATGGTPSNNASSVTKNPSDKSKSIPPSTASITLNLSESSASPIFWNTTHFTCQTREQQSNGATNETTIMPTFPHFIILGAQKAGTTALYQLLNRLPNLQGSKKDEPHFWDGLQRSPSSWTPALRCEYLLEYYQHWKTKKIRPQTIFFEKTPSLLALPRVPRYILEGMTPYVPKLIVILRDPVERWYSHYKMSWRFSGHRETFASPEAWMIESLAPMIHRQLIHAPLYTIQNQTYTMSNATATEHLSEWRAEDFDFLPTTKPKTLNFGYMDPIGRGFYAAQLKEYLKYFQFDVSLKVLCYEQFLENHTQALTELLDFVHPHKSTRGDNPQNDGAKLDATILETDWGPKHTTTEYPPLPDRARSYLKALYRPHNEELVELLGQSWRDIWD